MIDAREIVSDNFAGGDSVCLVCRVAFKGYHGVKKYCSQECRTKAHNDRHCVGIPHHRMCRTCGAAFVAVGQGSNNRQHCGEQCASVSARLARAAFARRHPEMEPVYRERQRAKKKRDTILNRLWRKYPWLPRTCEACGESRVLDVAHRPGMERKGAWISMKVNVPERIWILCPTCHALVDRCGYTQEQLGIVERQIPGTDVSQRAEVAA